MADVMTVATTSTPDSTTTNIPVGERDTDLPMSMSGYSFLGNEEAPETKPATDDKSPPQKDTAKAEKPEASKPAEPAKETDGEPISEALSGRARSLGMSDEQIRAYKAAPELERFVTMAERDIERLKQQYQSTQSKAAEKPAEKPAEPPPEEDWAKPILDQFGKHEYGSELMEDVTALTSAYKGQLSKRDETIKALQGELTQVRDYLMEQQHLKEIMEVGEFVKELGDDWKDVFGEDVFKSISEKGEAKKNLDKLWDASDEVLALARRRGEFITRKEAVRRAHLIDFHEKAEAIRTAKAKNADTKTDEPPRDSETGQFIARGNRSNGQRPKDSEEDSEAAYFAWKKKRGI